MSEIEGPPAKQAKLDLQKTDDSTMDGDETADEGHDGQEEWLSEDILTDDDYQPGIVKVERTDSQLTIDETTQDDNRQPEKTDEAKTLDIEETLNNLEGSRSGMPDDVEDFLVKKSESQTAQSQTKSETKEEDDGNDTDELLRMLSEDNNKTKKKLTKTVKDIKNSNNGQHSSDEEYEKSSDDETHLMKSMFNLKGKQEKKPHSKSNPDTQGSKGSITTKHIISASNKPVKKDRFSSTPLKTYSNKSHSKSVLKPLNVKNEKHSQFESRKDFGKIQFKSSQNDSKTYPVVKCPSTNVTINSKVKQSDEIVQDEEFLDEDAFNMEDEELESDLDDELSKARHRILRPGVADENATDESRSDDGSLYDEMPSSGSDDDEWFQLDIRAEKAADYLPLLGPKAKEVLLEEKRRVNARLNNLKQSLSALTESGKKQAEQLRSATMSLAQIDDLLKAS